MSGRTTRRKAAAEVPDEVPLKQQKLEKDDEEKAVTVANENDPPKPVAKESPAEVEEGAGDTTEETAGTKLVFRILHCTSWSVFKRNAVAIGDALRKEFGEIEVTTGKLLGLSSISSCLFLFSTRSRKNQPDGFLFHRFLWIRRGNRSVVVSKSFWSKTTMSCCGLALKRDHRANWSFPNTRKSSSWQRSIFKASTVTAFRSKFSQFPWWRLEQILADILTPDDQLNWAECRCRRLRLSLFPILMCYCGIDIFTLLLFLLLVTSPHLTPFFADASLFFFRGCLRSLNSCFP